MGLWLTSKAHGPEKRNKRPVPWVIEVKDKDLPGEGEVVGKTFVGQLVAALYYITRYGDHESSVDHFFSCLVLNPRSGNVERKCVQPRQGTMIVKGSAEASGYESKTFKLGSPRVTGRSMMWDVDDNWFRINGLWASTAGDNYFRDCFGGTAVDVERRLATLDENRLRGMLPGNSFTIPRVCPRRGEIG
jgi:hypothetical protein